MLSREKKQHKNQGLGYMYMLWLGPHLHGHLQD